MEHTISTDQHIINTLLLNASIIDKMVIMHGKMGISVFYSIIIYNTQKR
jgi:hypothetical protein